MAWEDGMSVEDLVRWYLLLIRLEGTRRSPEDHLEWLAGHLHKCGHQLLDGFARHRKWIIHWDQNRKALRTSTCEASTLDRNR